ncbi:DeoR family transcriptional regulator [Virgibacillus dokdonensis]|uniref:DeoR family transcriptional regulator n=1 Tax=Virgibacillus dokdonensis TaxID=302167 RepID=A0ABU7VL29_9BACI
MLQEQRHHMIESFLKQQKAVKASELATLLDVSIDTIRRDFEVLEKNGIIKKVHGGAILKQKKILLLINFITIEKLKIWRKSKRLL